MDPPCPNFLSNVTAPVFSNMLMITPPTLRVRVSIFDAKITSVFQIFANNNVMITILLFILYCFFGLWSLLILGFFLIFILIIYLNERC